MEDMKDIYGLSEQELRVYAHRCGLLNECE